MAVREKEGACTTHLCIGALSSNKCTVAHILLGYCCTHAHTHTHSHTHTHTRTHTHTHTYRHTHMHTHTYTSAGGATGAQPAAALPAAASRHAPEAAPPSPPPPPPPRSRARESSHQRCTPSRHDCTHRRRQYRWKTRPTTQQHRTVWQHRRLCAGCPCRAHHHAGHWLWWGWG